MTILYLSAFHEKGKEQVVVSQIFLIIRMTKAPFVFIISIFLVFLNPFTSFAEDKKPEAKPDAKAAPPPAKADTKGGAPPPAATSGEPPVVRYLPRYIKMPVVSFGKEPSIEGEMELDFSHMRFWYVAVIASWNPRSAQISEVFNKNYGQFVARKIGVIGLFSQDTVEAVSEWRKKIIPKFMNEFASRDFLDSLKNPKVPTVWLVGSEGQILQRLEMPTVSEMSESINKAMILTGF